MRSQDIWALVASAGLATCSCKNPTVDEAGLTILSYNDLTSKWASQHLVTAVLGHLEI